LGRASSAKSAPFEVWKEWATTSPADPLPWCAAAACEGYQERLATSAAYFGACFGVGHGVVPSPSLDPYFKTLSDGTTRAMNLSTTLAVSRHLEEQRAATRELLRAVGGLPPRPRRPKEAKVTVAVLSPLTPHLGGDNLDTAWGPKANSTPF